MVRGRRGGHVWGRRAGAHAVCRERVGERVPMDALAQIQVSAGEGRARYCRARHAHRASLMRQQGPLVLRPLAAVVRIGAEEGGSARRRRVVQRWRERVRRVELDPHPRKRGCRRCGWTGW